MQRRRVQNISGAYGDDDSNIFRQAQLSTALSTSTWQTADAGASAQDEQSFGCAQEYQYSAPQMQDSSSQYQPVYLQGPINQQQFPQDGSQMAYNAPTQPLYDNMPPYQSRQPTAEVLSKRFDIPQSYTAGDNRRVLGSGAMPQQYPIALNQQPLQYDPTTDLEHSTLASSDLTTEPEFPQAARAEPTDQQQREIDSYDYIYSQLMKTNENTSQGRLVAAAESLLKISEWLFSHAAGLGMSMTVL